MHTRYDNRLPQWVIAKIAFGETRKERNVTRRVKKETRTINLEHTHLQNLYQFITSKTYVNIVRIIFAKDRFQHVIMKLKVAWGSLKCV